MQKAISVVSVKCNACSSENMHYLPYVQESLLSEMFGCAPIEVLQKACAMGIMPERFLRNYSTYSPEEQGILLGSTVCIVGLGGLGGFIVDMLIRVGVGALICADGDTFEPSNLNRQLLSSEATLGVNKAQRCMEYSAERSSITRVQIVDEYLSGETLEAVIRNASIAVDALGGLQDKSSVVACAHSVGIPVVAGSIAGKCGYISSIPVGRSAPTDWLGSQDSIEGMLGNPPQIVAFTASLMVEHILGTLLSSVPRGVSYIFDIEHGILQRVSF